MIHFRGCFRFGFFFLNNELQIVHFLVWSFHKQARSINDTTPRIGGGLGPPQSQNMQQQQQQQQQHLHQQQMQQHHHHHQQLHQQQQHHHQQQQQQQQSSRSAASPLSPPRPGPGSAAAANTYAKFADVNPVREAPQRFILQSAYSIGPGAQYRESPYTRIPPMPPVQDYHRVAAAALAAANSAPGSGGVVQMPATSNVNISAPHGIEALHFAHPSPGHQASSSGGAQLLNNAPSGGAAVSNANSPHNTSNVPPAGNSNSCVTSSIMTAGGKRILLNTTHRQQPPYSNEYLKNVAVPVTATVSVNRHGQTQAPPDPGGQPPYKKMRLSDANNSATNNLPPHQVTNVQSSTPQQQQQRQPSPVTAQTPNVVRTSGHGHGQILPPHTHLSALPPSHIPQHQQHVPPPPQSVTMQQLKVETQSLHMPVVVTPPVNRVAASVPISSVINVAAATTATTNSPSISVSVTTTINSTSSSTEAYHPQVEAISPTLPIDSAEERGRTAKEDLLMQIQKVDTEITSADNALDALRTKEKNLMDVAAAAKQQKEMAAAAKKQAETEAETDAQNFWRSQTLAQKIYLANQKTAAAQHSILDNCGERYLLPLYNQPLDVDHLTIVIQRHQTIIKMPLLDHLRKIKNERWIHHTKLVETYAQLSTEWQKRVDKAEGSAKRKTRESKNREFFEKVFTELRKQREDKERFNRVGSRIKSEADYEEIMDGLQEQAMEVRKMRSYAIIPPLMFNTYQRRCLYHNENGAVKDMVAVHKERAVLNVWTAGEKEIFKEKFLQHPKNFGAIAASLDRKSAQDCVRYYYLSKKTENYKQLLRKSRQRTRASKTLQKTQQQPTQCIIDSLTTGVTTRLQREQQQKTGGRSAAAERERERAERAAEREKTVEKAVTETTKAVTTTTIKTIKIEAVSVTTVTSATTVSSNIETPATMSADDLFAAAADTSQISNGGKNVSMPNSSNITTPTCMSADKSQAEKLSTAIELHNGTNLTEQENNTKVSSTECMSNGSNKAKFENKVPDNYDNKKSTNALSVSPEKSKEKISVASSGATTSVNSNTVAPQKTNANIDSAILPSSASLISQMTTASLTSLNNIVHPAASMPNGIKTSYAGTIPTQTGSAVASTMASPSKPPLINAVSDEIKRETSNTGNEHKATNINAESVVAEDTNNKLSVVSTPTTSTSAGNFLGQKLKAAQVESVNDPGNDCNSDVSESKRKRLDSVSTVASSAIASSQQMLSVSSSSNSDGSNNNNNGNSSSVSSTKNFPTSSVNSSVSAILMTTSNTNVNFTASVTTESATSTTFTGNMCSSIVTSNITLFSNNDGNAIDGKDKLATCFICKADNCLRTRPLKRGRGQQYDILDETIPTGARVCNTCQCKSVRARCPNCPLPTCPNPKDRAKRLRNIPARLYDLGAEVRDPIIKEFQIPLQATRCCSACLMRIRRKLDPHINLTDEERHTDGDESDVSTSSCDERDASGSDTASVESPKNRQRHNTLIKDTVPKPSQMVSVTPVVSLVSGTPSLPDTIATPTGNSTSNVAITKSDERLLPPLGHAPKKQKTSEEYDSSATETADEENENSPANRHSPKVILNSSNTNAAVVNAGSGLGPPPVSTNGPMSTPIQSQRHDVTSGDLQDFLYTVIERSLKQKGPPPSKMPSQSTTISVTKPLQLSAESGRSNSDAISSSSSNNSNSNNDVTIVREYRNDGSIKPQQQAHGQPLLSSTVTTNNSMQNINIRQPQQQTPTLRTNVSVSGGQLENLATLSVVNSYVPSQHLQPTSHNIMHHQQHDIKATITPMIKSGKTPTPPHVPPPETIIYASTQLSRNNEPEPQTLDLSIKKPSRDGNSPHTSSSGSSVSLSCSAVEPVTSRHQQMASNGSGKHVNNVAAIYRGSESTQLIGAPPNHTFLYHTHSTSVGVGKVPPPGSLYVSQVPVPMSITQTSGGSATNNGNRGQSTQTQPPQGQTSHLQLTAQHGKNISGANKIPSKLSPQIIHPPPPPSHSQAPSPSQPQQQLLVGPKGSITHGTPVNNATQQIIVHPAQTGATLSPKFDNLLRQTPPSSNSIGAESNKVGSITQGTPIHLPTHHMDNKRAYEYSFKSSQRQSPAQQQQQPPPQASQQNAYAVGPYSRPPYTVEQPSPVLSTRQIVMHDYITSQQMQGQQQRSIPRSGSASSASVGNSGKESPSSRNSGSGLVYYDKERGRTEYSSRASPADHANSTPSPHRTPPPPRQGVIQRHNTGGSKPPSPAAPPQSRMHVVMPHNYPPAGHDAFSSFVDVAVQQPQLPVPSPKDEKLSSTSATAPSPSASTQQQPLPSHHDAIRYQMNRDHMAALQLQHHHQQHAAAAAVVAQQQQAVVAAQQQQYRQHHAANAVDMQRRLEQAKRDQRMHNAALERDRDLQQKRQERERIERMHVERLDREREQREREREQRERNRERREQELAAEDRERDGRRMERIYAGNATTSAATGSQHYIRGPPSEAGPPRSISDRERDLYHRTHPGQPPSEGTLSAQTLIDAIIKHQISQGSSEPGAISISRDLTRSSFQYNSRDIGPSRQHASNATLASLAAAENNGKSSSPNIINIDLDNDRAVGSSSTPTGNQHEPSPSPSSRGGRSSSGSSLSTNSQVASSSQQPPQMRTKNITFGELTDTIISNDYGPNPVHLRGPLPSNFIPYMQDPQNIVTPDRWKFNRRVQKEVEAAAKGSTNSQPTSSSNSAANPSSMGGRSNTPGDERNIIRMPQAVSPRKYMQDFMIQQAAAAHDYHYQQHGPPTANSHGSSTMRLAGGPYDTNSNVQTTSGVGPTGSSVVQNHAFDTMKYVQNRIVEVMRTEDDHRASSGGANDDRHNDHRNKEQHEPLARKTPNQYEERDNGRRSSSSGNDSAHSQTSITSSYQPSPVTTFAATTYAYPYSALNVPSSVASLQAPQQINLNTTHQMPPTSISSSQKQLNHVLAGGSDGGANTTVNTASSSGANLQTSMTTSSTTTEPKPLLSAQYEALSDED
ncbi:nuclear receptor corepressor smrter isoform 4-T25 [Glossina fuscipes fuscipes]